MKDVCPGEAPIKKVTNARRKNKILKTSIETSVGPEETMTDYSRPLIIIRPSPFFFRSASNAFPDIGLVSRIEKKKLKSRNRRPSGTLGQRQKLTFTRSPGINKMHNLL